MLTRFLKPSLLIIFGIVLCDQSSKDLILKYFDQGHLPQSIFSFLDFILVWNRGISWGFFNNDSPYNALIFSGFASIIILILLVLLFQTSHKLIAYSFSFVIGGAIGNLIDRLRFGGVVDFIYFHWHEYAFPAFNIADTAITCGVIFMLLQEFKEFHKRRKNVF